MSQSPITASPEQGADYLKSWDALAEMIRQGRSFSGYERNCCYLNTGAQQFADVSAVLGLNQIEDGRGLAVVDWDQDGDLDLWLANRSSPRVRMLRNNLRTGTHFLALHLLGIRCNRDAIGARVEITLKDNPAKLIQTLRAGEGFLSQSSKWLHFGLGNATEVEQVTVRWPGDPTPQRFDGLQSDQRYQLVQDKALAVAVPPRGEIRLEPAELGPTPSPGQARIVLVQRRTMPAAEWTDYEGQPWRSEAHQGPQLINLWATWCAPCLRELEELKSKYGQLQSSGLKIIALNVDSLSQDDQTPQAKKIVSRLDLPFESGLASSHYIQGLREVDREILYSETPLPIPCSFLIDDKGRLAVVYKGPVETEQLMADLELFDPENKSRLAAAMPLGGKSITQWFSPDRVRSAQAFLEGGYVDDAKSELRKVLTTPIEDATPELIPALRLWATIMQRQGNTDQQLKALHRIAALEPQNPAARIDLALALVKAGQPAAAEKILQELEQQQNVAILVMAGQTRMSLNNLPRAIELFEQATTLRPNSSEIRFNLALAYQLNDQPENAIRLYRALLKDHPERHDLENNLAWVLATDGANAAQRTEAVERATAACQATAYQRAAYLDTLAVALARSGDQQQAKDVTSRAIQLARAQGQAELAAKLQERLDTNNLSAE